MVGNRPSGTLPTEHPLVARAEAATRYFGLEPTLDISSTDANVPIARGIPAVTIGGGGVGRGAHSPEEFWVDENSDLGIRRVLLLVVSEAGVP